MSKIHASTIIISPDHLSGFAAGCGLVCHWATDYPPQIARKEPYRSLSLHLAFSFSAWRWHKNRWRLIRALDHQKDLLKAEQLRHQATLLEVAEAEEVAYRRGVKDGQACEARGQNGYSCAGIPEWDIAPYAPDCPCVPGSQTYAERKAAGQWGEGSQDEQT